MEENDVALLLGCMPWDVVCARERVGRQVQQACTLAILEEEGQIYCVNENHGEPNIPHFS